MTSELREVATGGGKQGKRAQKIKTSQRVVWIGMVREGRFIGFLNWLAVTLTEMENWRAIIVIGMGVDKEKKLSSGNADFSTFSFQI